MRVNQAHLRLMTQSHHVACFTHSGLHYHVHNNRVRKAFFRTALASQNLNAADLLSSIS